MKSVLLKTFNVKTQSRAQEAPLPHCRELPRCARPRRTRHVPTLQCRVWLAGTGRDRTRWSFTGPGTRALDLSGAARRLSTVALLQRCDIPTGGEVIEALDEADLATVGDVIRYCCDGTDDESHIGAMSLELTGCLDRATLRRLLSEARALIDVTSKLPRLAAGADGGDDNLVDIDDVEPPAPPAPDTSVAALQAMTRGLQEDAAALVAGMGRANDSHSTAEALPESMSGSLQAMMAEMTAPANAGATAGGGAIAAMMHELQGGASHAISEPEPGERPGTHSIGC